MKADKQPTKTATWPVDALGFPTIDYLNTFTTKAKWDRFWKAADERSQLHGFIHLTKLCMESRNDDNDSKGSPVATLPNAGGAGAIG